jgi:hypothetical protein
MNARLRLALIGFGLLVGCAKPVATPAPKPAAIPQRAEVKAPDPEPPKPTPVAVVEDVATQRERKFGDRYRRAKEADAEASKTTDMLYPVVPGASPEAELERGRKFFEVYEAGRRSRLLELAKKELTGIENLEDLIVEGDLRGWHLPADRRWRHKDPTEDEVQEAIARGRLLRKSFNP